MRSYLYGHPHMPSHSSLRQNCSVLLVIKYARRSCALTSLPPPRLGLLCSACCVDGSDELDGREPNGPDSFYKVYDAVFERNKRFAVVLPAPSLGEDDTPIEEVCIFLLLSCVMVPCKEALLFYHSRPMMRVVPTCSQARKTPVGRGFRGEPGSAQHAFLRHNFLSAQYAHYLCHGPHSNPPVTSSMSTTRGMRCLQTLTVIASQRDLVCQEGWSNWVPLRGTLSFFPRAK